MKAGRPSGSSAATAGRLRWGTAGSAPTVAFGCVQVCPTGALFDKGRAVAEMRKDRGFLKYIVTAREKKQWIG